MYTHPYIYACQYYIYIYIQAYKYTDITCSASLISFVYMFFRADHLILDNKLVCSFLRSTISPTVSIPYLPMFLCVELRPQGLSPVHIRISIVSCLISSVSDSHVGETWWVQLSKLLGNNIVQKTLFSSSSYYFSAPCSIKISEPQV